jgi:hypothetical protein
MDRQDFLSTVSLCLYSHPVQQDETLAKALGATNVGVLVVFCVNKPGRRFIYRSIKKSSTKVVVNDECPMIFFPKVLNNGLVFLKKIVFTNVLIGMHA